MGGTCCKIINRRSHQGASHRITWTGCFYRKYLVASSARGVADTETINTDDTVTSVELKKKKEKKAEGLKRNWRENNAWTFCQRKLIRTKLVSGYPKVIRLVEQNCCYVLHRNRPSGQTM